MTSLGSSLMLMANASAASDAMRTFLTPMIATLCVLASLACTFFLVTGGIEYMTSTGKPENLEHAKGVIKNALIGLILVIAAVALTAILSHAYSSSTGMAADKLPALTSIQQDNSTSFWDVITKAIVHVLQNIVSSIGEPFVKALSFFTNSTPLMGDNSNVFNLWLAIVGIADALFVLVVALLGFHIMSFSAFGFDELDLRQVLPQMALTFLLINTSIFAIDAIIGLSNGMIHALQSGFPCTSIWDQLADITKKSSDLGLGGLLVMIAFLVLTIMLLVYYVGRLITLYIGAVLSPLVLLLYLLPAFKDFATSAIKVYLTTIFVLFVQVVIMQMASSIFSGMLQGDASGQPNILMALILGLATVLALLKTQGVMKELSYAASTPRAAKEMAGSFIRGVSYMNRARKGTVKTAKANYKRGVKVNNYIRNKRAKHANEKTPDPKTGQSVDGENSSSASAKPKARQLKTGETHFVSSRPDNIENLEPKPKSKKDDK